MNETLNKYNEIFKSIFNVEEDQLQDLKYKEYPEWNSMAHIALISTLEDTFGVCFEAEDIFSFTSYAKGKSLMKSRFGLEL